MKNFSGAEFMKRVISLFREESGTLPPTQKTFSHSEGDPIFKGDSAQSARDIPKGHASNKSRESNIDRYKHPSDIYKTGY
jgi:hypothetical protein